MILHSADWSVVAKRHWHIGCSRPVCFRDRVLRSLGCLPGDLLPLGPPERGPKRSAVPVKDIDHHGEYDHLSTYGLCVFLFSTHVHTYVFLCIMHLCIYVCVCMNV